MKNKPTPDSIKKHLERSNDWNFSIIERTKRSEKIAWRVASVAAFIAALAVVAVAGLTPLKSTIPFLVTVNEKSGVPDLVPLVAEYDVSADDVIAKYWVAKYIVGRESFDINLVQNDYDQTRSLSEEGEVLRGFESIFDGPAALHKKYGNKSILKVKILSVTFDPQKNAIVRFSKELVDRQTGSTEERSTWVATVSYWYNQNLILTESQRLLNPFGFKVKSYRLDREL